MANTALGLTNHRVRLHRNFRNLVKRDEKGFQHLGRALAEFDLIKR